MQTSFTIGWWNNSAAAACGQPAVLAATETESMTVTPGPDLSVDIAIWRDRLRVPAPLVRPLLDGLGHFDVIALPIDEAGHSVRINAELMLDLQPDATLVVVIGADEQPGHALEIPGCQIERLKQALREFLA